MSNLPAPNPKRFGVATPGYPTPSPYQQPPPPAQRRLRRRTIAAIIVGLVIVIAAIAWGTYRLGHNSVATPATQTVLETTRAIPEGARISSADLRPVTIQGRRQPGQAGVNPGDTGRLIGQVANQALPAGTIVTAGEVAPTGAVPSGDQTLIGLDLKPNQVPQNGLAVGERVGVINVPGSTTSQGPPPTPVPLTDAAVWNITANQDGSTNCEITVPNTLSATIAADSARQQIILIRLAPNAPFPPHA